MNIPTIITAVVNSSYWVSRLLFSVDYPVDNFFIINNNGRGQLDEELEQISKIKHKFIKKIQITNLPANLGVPGAWNLGIKCFLNSPFWIICNDDIAFSSGFLEEMVTSAIKDPEVGIVHGRQGDYETGNFDNFLIKDWVIQEYGLFDENFYPAYCEDADYLMRIRKKPLKRIMQLQNTYYHGFSTDYYEGGRQTSKTEEHLAPMLDEVNRKNFDYMTEKWGPSWRVQAPQEHVYGVPSMPISYTSFNLEFARSKYLGF